MARFHKRKAELLRICAGEDWRQTLGEHIDGYGAAGAVAPLLALLPRPDCVWQAAYGLGLAVSRMAKEDMEAARIVMRRLMWSMNEESGNLGWGIPEAMGCILAESPALAGEYGRILLSYVHDTGREDNFIDHAPLRRGVCWGIGRLASAGSAAARPALPRLVGALGDEDVGVRLMAAFAIQQYADNIADGNDAQEAAAQWQTVECALEEAKEAAERTRIGATTVLFDGRSIAAVTLADILLHALGAVKRRLALDAVRR